MSKQPVHPRRSPAAFTLVELLISIALVLVLIAGVNMVFTMTADTVGAGQAQSTITRDNRAAQAVFYSDFSGVVLDQAPFFMITSERIAAFRNRQDEQSDYDYDPTSTNMATIDAAIRSVDLNQDGDESDTGETGSPAVYNSRNHRVDVLSFFARGMFHRQTGNDGVYLSNMSSSEAWIKYGHLRQPDATFAMNAHKEPGYEPDSGSPLTAVTNPNNFYATQWILGRSVMLLRQPDANYQIFDNATPTPNAQYFIGRASNATMTPVGNPSLAPLAVNSNSTVGGSPTGYAMGDPFIQWSRYDLAGETIATYNTWLSGFITAHPAGTDWWSRMAYRFQGNPFPTRPHSSEGAARTVPAFVSSCTQFIVEYAGDFFSQDPTTGVINGSWVPGSANPPDGITDYIQLPDGERRIRWYGMPRNVDTSDDTSGIMIRGGGAIADFRDVVPFYNVYTAAGGLPTLPTPYFERTVPVPQANFVNMNYDDDYVAAWGPDTLGQPYPTMIRITLTIDDPNGRLADGQTFEYVINLR